MEEAADGITKVNVDSSFHYETMSGATGTLARDDHGNFIAAAAWVSPQISSAESARSMLFETTYP